MGKSRQPRKRKDAISNEVADSEKEIERQTQEKAELVPPARRPVVSERYPPALIELAHAIRSAVVALLDVADAAAEVIARRLEGRA